MSVDEDEDERQKKWDHFEADVMPAYVVRINDLEERKGDIVREIAERVATEKLMPPGMICSFLKDILKRLRADISERTIERALGNEYKEQKNVIDDWRHVSASNSKKTIEVSSSGEENVFTPIPPAAANPMPEYDESKEVEQQTEKVELRDSLKERDAMITGLDKRINELEMENANMEVALSNKTVDYDKLQQRIGELEEIERLRIKKEDFTTASNLPMPTATEIWIYAENMKDLWLWEREVIGQANKEPEWNPSGIQTNRRVFFDLNSAGEITGVRLEKK